MDANHRDEARQGDGTAFDVLVNFGCASLVATTDDERRALADQAEQELARLAGGLDEIARNPMKVG